MIITINQAQVMRCYDMIVLTYLPILTLLYSFRPGMVLFRTLGLGGRLTALRAHRVVLD